MKDLKTKNKKKQKKLSHLHELRKSVFLRVFRTNYVERYKMPVPLFKIIEDVVLKEIECNNDL